MTAVAHVHEPFETTRPRLKSDLTLRSHCSCIKFVKILIVIDKTKINI